MKNNEKKEKIKHKHGEIDQKEMKLNVPDPIWANKPLSHSEKVSEEGLKSF